MENVLVGMHTQIREGLLDTVWRTKVFRESEDVARARAVELIRQVGLEGKQMRSAHQLSYGDQRRLELARALGSKPKLLLLDEPTAGMNPSESQSLMKLLKELVAEVVETLMIIEHNMRIVMGVSDRVMVLDYGRKIADGTPNEIVNNPRVIEAYLGRGPRSADA